MAVVPPLTALIVPFISALETWYSPLLAPYVPFLGVIQVLMQLLTAFILSFQAFDLLGLVFPALRLKSGRLTDMIDFYLPQWWKDFLPSTLSTQRALGYANHQQSLYHPSFSGTMSFASNVLNALDDAHRRYDGPPAIEGYGQPEFAPY